MLYVGTPKFIRFLIAMADRKRLRCKVYNPERITKEDIHTMKNSENLYECTIGNYI